MCYTVIELTQLCVVPAVSGTYEVACDTLQLVNPCAATLGTHLKHLVSVLITAV